MNDCTYRSSCPDFEHNLSFYGSEPYHCIIAKGLADKGHDVHWFAPQGSQDNFGTFHPILNFNGSYIENEILDDISLEGLKVEYLKDFDFIFDFTAVARNIEDLHNYYGYQNYGVFRNGYTGYNVPRLRLKDRHYIVPSNANRRIFESHGFPDVTTIYYGIPDFYCAGEDEEYRTIISSKENGISSKGYYLYPHRPTNEKGSFHVLQLAQIFPKETFVFMVSNNPVPQHQDALLNLKRQVVALQLNNVKFVELPLTNKHHYFKRELYRHAKAILSPFNPNIYKEGFGLANCLLPDHKILLKDGVKNIQDIKQNDLALTHIGRFKPVTQTMNRQYNGKIVSILAYGFSEPLKVTPEHPVYLIKRNWRNNWGERRASFVNAEYVEKGDCIVFPYPQTEEYKTSYDLMDYVELTRGFECKKCGHVFMIRTPIVNSKNKYRQCTNCFSMKYLVETTFKNIVEIKETGKIHVKFTNQNGIGGFNRVINIDEDLGKILGFWIAEGSSSSNDMVLEWYQKKDITILDELQQSIEKVFGLKSDIRKKRNNIYRLTLINRLITKFVKKICGSGALNKKIPKEILYGQNLSVLRTLIEYMVKGDGHRDSEGNVKYFTVSEQLANEVKLACIRLGFKPTIFTTTKLNGFQSNNKAYVVSWIDNPKNLVNYSHSNKIWYGKDGLYYLIRDVKTEEYSGLVYNFEVEDDHSYTTPNGSVHNCEAVACGTPILITDSESSRELWIDEVDGLILPYDDNNNLKAFRMAIRHFDSYNFSPKNKFTVDDCIKNYEKFINKVVVANNEKNE